MVLLGVPALPLRSLGWWMGTGGTPRMRGGHAGRAGGRVGAPHPPGLVRAVSLSAAACRELTLQKGDIVYIHKEVDRNWLEGEHHGRVGIFPSNYVEVSPGDGERAAELGEHGTDPHPCPPLPRFCPPQRCPSPSRHPPSRCWNTAKPWRSTTSEGSCPSSSPSARYRRAVPRRAVPCRAMPC